MCSIGMTQTMYTSTFPYTCLRFRICNDQLSCPGAICSVFTLKKKFFGPVLFIIFPQYFEQLFTQWHHPVFFSFPAPYMDHHPLGVYIANPYIHQFTYSQS